MDFRNTAKSHNSIEWNRVERFQFFFFFNKIHFKTSQIPEVLISNAESKLVWITAQTAEKGEQKSLTLLKIVFIK
jgi:hypothetical protein